MTHVTYRLTSKNRDQLRNPTLGNGVWATFTSTFLGCIAMHSIRCGLLLPTSRPEGCVSVIVTRLSVCLSGGHKQESAETDERIEIPFAMW